MEYMSTVQAAEKWGISSQRVRLLCQEGRIEGVSQVGRAYLIPIEAQKPEDGRTKESRELKNKNMEGTK